YRKGVPTDTIEQRRQGLEAWVYAPFVTEDFLKGVLGLDASELDLDVFAGASTSPADLIFDYDGFDDDRRPDAFERITQIELAGQHITLGWTRARGFVATNRNESA